MSHKEYESMQGSNPLVPTESTKYVNFLSFRTSIPILKARQKLLRDSHQLSKQKLMKPQR